MKTIYFSATLMLLSSLIQAQVIPSKIENFVFQGVGSRGVTHVGALQAIQDDGRFTNVKRVAGVSSGSIISLLYALKYTPEKIKKIMFDIDFSSLEDKPNIFRVKKEFGYYKGKRLETLLKCYVSESTLGLSEDATFADLQNKDAPELYIFTANLNTYSLTELSFRKTPDVKLWEAVRSSISIPFVFPAWKFSQGLPGEYLHIDGGVVFDFPVNFFDYQPFNEINGEVNLKTLGFLVHNIADDQAEIKLKYGSSFKAYFEALYQIVVDGQISVIETNPDEQQRIVTITIDGDSSFDLTPEQKKDLYNRGYKYTNEFLEGIK